MAGSRASQSPGFGVYVTGLQTGGTGYLTEGGTSEKAIAFYSAARKMTANENLAATLMDQVTRLSGGAYEQPRRVVERFAGKRWGSMSMDDRLDAVQAYVTSLPAGGRVETMTKRGFAPEMAMVMSKMVSAPGLAALAEATKAVTSATTENVDQQVGAYLNSHLGKTRSQKGITAGDTVGQGGRYENWIQRMTRVKDKFKFMQAAGEDRLSVADKYEPHLMAYEEMRDELDELMAQLPDGPESKRLRKRLWSASMGMRSEMGGLKGIGAHLPVFNISAELATRRGMKYEDELSQLRGEVAGVSGPTTVIYDNSSNTIINPIVSGDTGSLRGDPNDVFD